MRLATSFHSGSIVATNLETACSQRCGTVIVTVNHHIVDSKTFLEVWPHRSHKYNKQILPGRVHANLCAGANEQWAYVERSAALVWRNKLLVQFHHLCNHLTEKLHAYTWHKYSVTTALQTLGVCLKTKNSDLAILATESLEPLKGTLTIVQASCRHVNVYIFVGMNLYSPPCAILIMTTHITIGFPVTKTDVRPIHIVHFYTIFFF